MSVFKAILVALMLSSTSAFALVLDWSAVSWTPGSLSQAYDVDSDGTHDVLITVAGQTSALLYSTPQITTLAQGGQSTAPSTLGFALDFSNTSGAITVYVTFLGFHAGDVSFSLFDVDGDRKGNSSNYAYQDQLRNLSDIDGKSIPTVTTGSSVTYSGGTALGTAPVPETGTGSGAGNVNVTFQDPVKTLQFTFGSSTDIAGNNPDAQEFAIHNITFKKPVVPEVGVPHIAFLVCLVIVGGRWAAQRFLQPA